MSTKTTKKNKKRNTASSSALHEIGNGLNEKRSTNVSLNIGFRTKTLLVLKFTTERINSKYRVNEL